MDPRVREVIELMNADFSRPVSINKIARRLGLSSSRLTHLFRADTGTSPGQYLQRLRIRKAKELLETTHLSVKDIMVRVGLKDQSHFVRTFRKIYGETPARYRARYLASRSGNDGERAGSQVRVAESANK